MTWIQRSNETKSQTDWNLSQGASRTQAGGLFEASDVLKPVSLAPGFSQVTVKITEAGNRLNGFRESLSIPLTWLKPGANETCAQYDFEWFVPSHRSLHRDTKQNMRYHLQSCIAWMKSLP